MKSANTALPWRRLWKIGRPFWVSEKRNIAMLHLVAVLILLSANALLAVFVNYTAGHFMTAIEQKSITEFYHYLLVYIGAFLVVTPVHVFYDLMRTRLALVWRKWLSARLFSLYYNDLAYYKLSKNNEIDNPDQRMTQDVDSFCNSSVGLFISVLDAVVNVSMFIGLLWAISPTLTYTVIAYSAGGSLIVVLIGKALVKLNFKQFKVEADLRYSLTETRRDAESIALSRSEHIALAQANGQLDSIIDNLMSIMLVHRNIQFFTGAYNRLMPLIPAAIIAPLYFKGAAPFGDITQATMAFTSVFQGATIIISQFSGISTYTAIINRIGSFIESIEALKAEDTTAEKQIEVKEGAVVTFDQVSILTPDLSKLMVDNLCVSVNEGEGLVIRGADGSGKSALLRSLAGIWTSGSGVMTRPPVADMLFVGQQFYIARSTLREALGGSKVDGGRQGTRYHHILTQVQLPDLVKRCGGLDTPQNWRTVLSLSEQQKLNIARAIFTRPKWIIMDEATSALDGETEKLFCQMLKNHGITIISTSRSSNLSYPHEHQLNLSVHGYWEFIPAQTVTKTA